jgi:hypothetical protein
MSGVNGNVIMSGCGDDNLDDERREGLEIIQRVFRAELTMGKASLVLGVSERQCYRIKARVKQHGVRGVVHGNRGRRYAGLIDLGAPGV